MAFFLIKPGMVLLGVYVAKSRSWLVREIQFLAGCRPPHNCQGKCPLSFGILFVGAQSLYLELRTKNPSQEFAHSFAWTFRFTQVKFLSCRDGFEKNKFQGFWQYIYVGTAKNSFTVKLFQDGNRDVTCFYLFVYLGEFIRFWLSSDSHKEQLLSTHPNTQKNQGNDSMNVWNCFIQLISLNYCQIKTFTLEAAMRAKVSQLQRLHQRNMICHNVQNKKGNNSRNNW